MQPIVVNNRQGYALGAIFLAMAGLLTLPYVFVDPAHRTDDAVGHAMIAALALGALGAFATARDALTADDDGLCRRTWRGTVHLRWRDVRDFHTVAAQHFTLDVVAPADDDAPRFTWDAKHPQAAALRAAVLAHATRAAVREWGPVGSRAIEVLPRTFTYGPPLTARSAAALSGAVSAVLLAYCLWLIARGEPPPIPRAHLLAMELGMMAFLLLPFGLMLSAWASGERAYHQRRGQRVVVREDGLRYFDERREVAMPWGEIVAVAPTGGAAFDQGTIVVSSRRASFDVGAGLTDLARFKALLARRAPAAVARGRASEFAVESLLPADATPGVATHHYRTRSGRALLSLPLVFGALFLGVAARDGDLVGPGVTALVFLGAWLWLLDGYLFTRVELDARGLTLRRRGGARALAWAELAAWRVVKAEALTHLVIEGRGERWRVWATVLDFEGLCAALSDRRPPDAPSQ